MRYILLSFLILLGLWLRYDPEVKGKLLEADGYYWKSLGEQSPKVSLGISPNPLRLAPSGTREDFSLHPILTRNYSFKNFYLYEGLLVILMGLIAYHIGGFFLSSVLLYSPLLVARTAIGWNDTDIYVCIFSILILHNLNQKKYVLAGLLVSGLALLWPSGVLFSAVALFYWVCSDRKATSLIKLGLILLPILLWSYFQVRTVFSVAPIVLKNTGLGYSGLLSTSELQWPGIEKLIALVTPEFLLAIGLAYILALQKRDWFVVAAIAYSALLITKGERFLVLIVPSLGVLIYQHIKKFPTLLTFVFTAWMVVHAIPAKSLHKYLLIMDDAWLSSTRYINSTPNNSIIASWWSPGHLISGEGKRAVIVDGGSQHLPRLFWIARALASTNLDEGKLILCYLATYGDKDISLLLDQSKSWDVVLQYMANKLSDIQASQLRPTYLLIYKEMLLNFYSIRQVATDYPKAYSIPPVPNIYGTIYYKLLEGQFDKILPPQYNYNDGKNTIRIWRLS